MSKRKDGEDGCPTRLTFVPPSLVSAWYAMQYVWILRVITITEIVGGKYPSSCRIRTVSEDVLDPVEELALHLCLPDFLASSRGSLPYGFSTLRTGPFSSQGQRPSMPRPPRGRWYSCRVEGLRGQFGHVSGGDGGAVVSGRRAVLREKEGDGFEASLHQTCRGSTRCPWLRCAAGSTVVMTPRKSGIWQHDRPPFSCHLFPRPIPILSSNTRYNRTCSVPGPLLLPSAICPSWFGPVPTPSGPQISRELLSQSTVATSEWWNGYDDP